MRDRSLSSKSFVFGFSSMTQQHLQLLNTSHIFLSYKKVLYEITLNRTWGFIVTLIWGKTKHVLKTNGDKLFKDLLINKIFSKQVLSWNFKMEFCLNKGLVWKFLGWKLIILIAIFCKIIICWIVLQFWAQTRQQ